MVFNRNKMRILKPDFWKEHFPIQLFYRLFNHFSEFYILSSEHKKSTNPILPSTYQIIIFLRFLTSEYYLLLDYLKTVNIIFDATRLFYSSS